MGLFDFLKKETKELFIARPDNSKDLIIYKWPDSNIRMMSQLTVQQDEVAVFFKEGKVVGTLDAGTHKLDGASIPFLSGLIDSATGGNFLISELYFVSKKQFVTLPFGGMIDNVVEPTTNLAINIRVFGEYAMSVSDPSALILNLVGTKGITSNEEITDWIKNLLLKEFREIVSQYVSVDKKPVLGIAAQASEFEKQLLEMIVGEVSTYGVKIERLGNVTVNIKEEDEATLKQMTRDFAYANNTNAADVAVKLGMAKGLENGSDAGSNAVNAAATGMGIALGMDAVKQTKNTTPTNTEPTSNPNEEVTK
ncbi:MAG TPA: SPFH domain-containing protein [Candidatus Dojkabacteria bacterium]|nr:SPFH domain-containing protein [Candidatus Dojkabacteria bacterium]